MKKCNRLGVGLVIGAACCVLIGLPREATAQDKVGTTGMQFLEIGVSPRADGLGGAFSAIADDASAVYYNPAGMVQLENTQLMISHIDYPVDINYNFVGLVLPLRVGGVLGLGYYGLDAGQIDRTTYSFPYGDGTTFGAKDYALSVSYGRFLTDRFSAGITAHFIHMGLADKSVEAMAFDFGLVYRIGIQ